VALKLLPLEISVDPAFAERFHREARTLARLNHPNIVGVYDFGKTSEGHLYFVMEFVEGTDLHRIIHGPGLTPAQSFEIIIGVCEALAYAHGKGVIHRDIKPANVLVNTEGQVKVADFGLARRNTADQSSWSQTVTGTVMGTPAYMAPEQMGGQHVDHRADIYSLGVMLYEMLCGEVPRGVFDPPSRKAPVDSRVDEVVHKAMQSEPDRRYQQTSEMKLAVDRIRSTPPQPAEVGSRKAEVEKRSARSPAVRLGLAAVAALVLGLGGWLAFRPRPEPLTQAQLHAAAKAADAKPQGAATFLSPTQPAAAEPRTPAEKMAGEAGAGTTATGMSPLLGAPPPATSPKPATPAAVPREWLVSKTASVPPPADALEFQGSRYKFVPGQFSWAAAKAKAEEMGGHLATITSKEEDDFIAQKIGPELTEATSWLWMGAFTVDSKAPWRWITGEAWAFADWNPDEPNFISHGKPAPPPYAAAVQRRTGLQPLFRWIEHHTTTSFSAGYLVEWDRFSAADAAANDPAKWNEHLLRLDVRSPNNMSLPGVRFRNGAVRLQIPKNGEWREVTIAIRATEAADRRSIELLKILLTPSAVSVFHHRNDRDVSQMGPMKLLVPSLVLSPEPDRSPRVFEVRAIDNMVLVYLDSVLVLSADNAPLDNGYLQVISESAALFPTVSVQSFDQGTTVATSIGKGGAAVQQPAPPKPPSEMEKWIAQVDGPQQAAFQKDVLQPYETGLAGLRSRYTAALERAMAELSKAGKLEEALAHRTERDTFAQAQTVPPDDGDQPNPAIQKLRAAYRAEAAKLDQTRLTAAKALHAKYDAVLAQSQTALTQRHRLDDALLLKTHREAVKAAWLAAPGGTSSGGTRSVLSPTSAGGGGGDQPAPPPNPPAGDQARDGAQPSRDGSFASRPVVKKYPKGDDRKAAEWVLSVGGSVEIQVGAVKSTVRKSEDLPRGRFALVGVRLMFPASGPPQPIDNLDALAGLEDLARVETGYIRLRDEHLAPLTSLPRLDNLGIENASLTDAATDYAAMMPALKRFSVISNAAFSGVRLADLAKTKITEIILQGCAVSPDAFPALAKCKSLTHLNIRSTRTTDADVAKLAELDRLEYFVLSGTQVTLDGLRSLKALRKIRWFAWSFTRGQGREELTEIARLFPQITTFEVHGVAPTEEDIAACAAFRLLTRLDFWGDRIADDAVRGIAAAKGLQDVRLTFRSGVTDVGLGYIAAHKGITKVICNDASKITDAGLLKLAVMNQLKRVEITDCPQLTPAGFAAFQKARPDVTLVR
jgi:hypothetical protein